MLELRKSQHRELESWATLPKPVEASRIPVDQIRDYVSYRQPVETRPDMRHQDPTCNLEVSCTDSRGADR